MNKLAVTAVLASGMFVSNHVFAGECGKDVMGGCETKSYNGVAVHMQGSAVEGAKVNAKREHELAEAHKEAQRLLAEANAQSKASADAQAKKSLVAKVKEKLVN